MVFPDEVLCQTYGRSFLLALRQKLGLGAAYSAFRLAAEAEDRAERLRSAAWDVFGRAIVLALSLPKPDIADAASGRDTNNLALNSPGAGLSDIGEGLPTLFANAPELKPIALRISDSLELLGDAGRVGGNLSAAAISTIAEGLCGEFRVLLAAVERLLRIRAATPPGLEA